VPGKRSAQNNKSTLERKIVVNGFVTHLPSFIWATSILVLGLLAYKYYFKRNIDKEKLNSISWIIENSKTVRRKIYIPLYVCLIPLAEEIIFRMPLLWLYENTSQAWTAIILSSILFGALHIKGGVKVFPYIKEKHLKGDLETDDLKVETKKMMSKLSLSHKLFLRINTVFWTFWLSIACAYYTIKFQNIWIGVGIHAAWNFFLAELVIGIIVMLIILIGGLALRIFEWHQECFRSLVIGIKLHWRNLRP
jgi:membrane protease YdiL (CAAX protease family)